MPKLTADKLAAQLSKATVAPVYLLTGEDLYRKEQVVAQLRAVVNPDEFNFFKAQATSADVSEGLAQANTAPVFSSARMVVLTGIDKLRKGSKEQLALIKYAQHPLETTTLVLTHNDPKKLKTDKVLSNACEETGCVVNFDELKAAQLNAWVRNEFTTRQLNAEANAVELLCQSVGGELAALANEIEKISLFVADRTDKRVTQEDVLACIGFSKEENPFELSNALLACDRNGAMAQIDKLLAGGEDAVGILAKMTYPILKMARIKRLSEHGLSSAEIVRGAGLLPWESRLVAAARRYPAQAHFLAALNKIIEADSGFKSGANLDPKTTLKGIVLTLLR